MYETAPVGGPPQGDFLNAAVLVDVRGEPLELLDALLSIERSLGRVRDARWGPRTIDLDILWIEGVVFEHPRLVVPHPHLTERAFALAPLLELVPAAVDPRTGRAYVMVPGVIARLEAPSAHFAEGGSSSDGEESSFDAGSVKRRQ